MPENPHEEKFALLTLLIIGANVAAFVLSLFYFDTQKIFNTYAFSKELFFSGNYINIVTSSFLHVDLTHLFWNMIFLFLFGRVVEKELGRGYFVLIYFFSMILGNIFFAFLFPGSIAVGASGAVFGLMGAAMLVEPFRPILKFIPIPLALIGAVYLAVEVSNAFNLNEGIAHVAHVGGMLGGFFIALIAEKERSKRGIMAVALFLLLATTIGLL